MWIVGWGQQATEKSRENPLTRAMKMWAQSHIVRFNDYEMEIGLDMSSPRQCYGDSGGGSYIQLPSGELRIVGVTSHSYGIGCNEGAVDTRVDAYLDWIDDTIKHESL